MASDISMYSFTWKIKQFSLCALETSEALTSPTFRAESIGGSEWFLKFYPRGLNEAHSEFVSCFLHRLQNVEDEWTPFEIMMTDENKDILASSSGEEIVTESGTGWLKFIAIEELNKRMEKCKKDFLIISCDLESCSDAKDNSANECEVWTSIGVDKCFFKWNVNLLEPSNLEDTKDVDVGKRFHFELTLTAPSDEIEIDIRRLDDDTSKSKCISCKLSLMNLKGNEVKSKTATHLFKKNATQAQNSWKFPNLFSKNVVLDRMDEFTKNNTFTLKGELSASTGEYFSEFKRVYFENSSKDILSRKSFSVLSGNLRNMLNSQKHSDVDLCIGNKVFHAHKSILSARSPVFNAMFEHDMVENKTKTVDIEDVNVEAFGDFLEYIYTGTVKKLKFENTKELLVVADKYQIQVLVEECIMILESELSDENVCEVYTLANLINNQRLKTSSLEHIEANTAAVLLSQSWSAWMMENVEAANGILYKLALDSS